MSSLLKLEALSQGQAQPQSYVERFQKSLAAMDSLPGLEVLMKKLQFLGLHFDPFDQDVSTECEEILGQLELKEEFQNPYQATNILLRLLDLTEERISQIKQ